MAEYAHHPERKEAVSFVYDLLGPPGSHRFHLYGRTILRGAGIQCSQSDQTGAYFAPVDGRSQKILAKLSKRKAAIPFSRRLMSA
ncbi:hypothetical protein [Lacticaseibacillus sp. N501-2]|uniref:hypothetical protein n=1 Tax=Lacticaseibacillus salsurae TaxID=3367729 RepID=UPI0038B2351B